MKATLALFAFLLIGIAASTDAAKAVVYCQYIDYPPHCVARPGVVLKPRVVAPRVVAPRVVEPGVVEPVRRGAVRRY